jgi:hypothetical protein
MYLAHTTEHAAARLRQRGIPGELLELLVEFGHERHDGHGARVLAFNKKARRQMRRALGAKAFARWESRLNVHAVVSLDEALVTVGHRVCRRYGKSSGAVARPRTSH